MRLGKSLRCLMRWKMSRGLSHSSRSLLEVLPGVPWLRLRLAPPPKL